MAPLRLTLLLHTPSRKTGSHTRLSSGTTRSSTTASVLLRMMLSLLSSGQRTVSSRARSAQTGKVLLSRKLTRRPFASHSNLRTRRFSRTSHLAFFQNTFGLPLIQSSFHSVHTTRNPSVPDRIVLRVLHATRAVSRAHSCFSHSRSTLEERRTFRE